MPDRQHPLYTNQRLDDAAFHPAKPGGQVFNFALYRSTTGRVGARAGIHKRGLSPMIVEQGKRRRSQSENLRSAAVRSTIQLDRGDRRKCFAIVAAPQKCTRSQRDCRQATATRERFRAEGKVSHPIR